MRRPHCPNCGRVPSYDVRYDLSYCIPCQWAAGMGELPGVHFPEAKAPEKEGAKVTPAHLRPQGKFPPDLLFHEHPYRWLLRHRFAFRFRRNKRTCPNCGVVGTWKAYGLWWKDIDKRRWLCKWCGYMNSITGQQWCIISDKLTCWVGADSEEGGFTPEKKAQTERWSPWVG